MDATQLSTAPLFSRLFPNELEDLAVQFRPERYANGEVIFRQGGLGHQPLCD